MLTNETSRPPDWYSTKNCALQYARLLERVDTPKRKRERGDGGNETPGEIVTKMLSKREFFWIFSHPSLLRRSAIVMGYIAIAIICYGVIN